MVTTKKRSVAQLIANQIVRYVCDHESHSTKYKIVRVLPWIGFILTAIEKVADAGTLARSDKAQAKFVYRGLRFKVKYDHHVSARGGVVIQEVLPGRGSPEGEVAVKIRNIHEAEETYRSLEHTLDRFILERSDTFS